MRHQAALQPRVLVGADLGHPELLIDVLGVPPSDRVSDGSVSRLPSTLPLTR